jgi:VIT1/CCC1 family predicted Fe2+/Mn2+ transporter
MAMHHEHHVRSSETIRDIVIGMSDGLTVPFALAAGLSGAISSSGLVVTAGIAEIVAGSIAMGLGGYLAGRTEVDHYQSELKREYDEVERLPEQEKAEVKAVFAGFGLSAGFRIRLLMSWQKIKSNGLNL